MIPYGDDPDAKGFHLFTNLLIAANVVVFGLEFFSANIEQFINTYALIPANVSLLNLSSIYPFFTYMFLHGDIMHILSNMIFLWVFGDNIEEQYGHIPFLIIYFVSGFAAALLQYIIDPNSAIPILGASGAVAGILGAYLVRFPTAKVKTLVPLFPLFFTVRIPAFIMIGLWFFTQVFNGLQLLGMQTGGGVAWWAHVGGFLAGFLLAYILPRKTSLPLVSNA